MSAAPRHAGPTPARLSASARARRWAQALDRRFGFHSRGNVVAATAAVALLGGLASLCLGQDANWDLRNYHVYNGYAWGQGRLAQDLAPAQLQSYFNPALDVLQYFAMVHWPAPLLGLLMGVLHGLAFLPVAAIAWRVLEGHPQRARWVPALALAGLCSGAFLSELGGSMGDNSSALPALGALALVLAAQRRQRDGGGAALAWWLGAGALLGLAVSFKLTNAIYAVALGAAALCDGGRPARRLAGALALTVAAAVVFGCVSGDWYLRVWRQFGNPLFPQFNGVFGAALAQPVSLGDTRWLPRDWGEHLLWPLIFTVHPRRVSEIALVQAIWALLYLALLAAGLRWLARRPLPATQAARAVPVLLVFFGVGYVLWQALFGIHRYLVVLELLAPLVLWCLCTRVLARRLAGRVAGVLVAGSALVALTGWADWGHEPWAARAFAVQAPPMREPARSLVLMVGDAPQSWRIAGMPPQATYASVASNFPESDAYRQAIGTLFAQHAERYALMPATVDKKARRAQTLDRWSQRLGLSAQPGCRTLRWLVARGLRADLDETVPGRCRLVPRAGTGLDLAAADRAIREDAQRRLAGYGLALAPASCRTLASRIGLTDDPYQACEVVARP